MLIFSVNWTLDFGMGAPVMFVSCAHRRDPATGIVKNPAQSGGLLGGSSTADLSRRILDHRLLQDWLRRGSEAALTGKETEGGIRISIYYRVTVLSLFGIIGP